MIGIDYLGGANYGDVILKEHPAGYAAGFILNTNKPTWRRSNAWPVIEALAKSGRCPLIRVHAIWDDQHTMRPEYQRIILAERDRAVSLRSSFPNVTVEFSWLCENNMNREQNAAMLRAVNHKLITPVNSVFQGAIIPDCKHEVHGNHAVPGGRYNYSYDGDDCFQDNIVATRKKHANAEVFFLWSHRCNGHYSAKDSRPRPLRDSWPFESYLDAMIALTRNDPSGASLGGGRIYKSVAEDSGKGDWKDNKPCLITPEKAKEVLLVCDNGQTAGRLVYYGTFAGGGFRYYSQEWGYQIAEKAKRIQGHPIVKIMIGGKSIGKICPSHRAGSFR